MKTIMDTVEVMPMSSSSPRVRITGQRGEYVGEYNEENWREENSRHRFEFEEKAWVACVAGGICFALVRALAAEPSSSRLC